MAKSLSKVTRTRIHAWRRLLVKALNEGKGKYKHCSINDVHIMLGIANAILAEQITPNVKTQFRSLNSESIADCYSLMPLHLVSFLESL